MPRSSRGDGKKKQRSNRISGADPRVGKRFARVTVPVQLNDPKKRRQWGLPASTTKPGPYIIELNLQYVGGLAQAAADFLVLYRRVLGARAEQPPVRVARTYMSCQISVKDWRALIAEDQRAARSAAGLEAPSSPSKGAIELAPHDDGRMSRYRTIYRIWPDFPVEAHMDRSVATVKGDAALRAFDATGDGIVWAVVDSGIDANHPHFGNAAKPDAHALRAGEVAGLHRCFCPVSDGEPGSLPTRLSDPDLPQDGELTEKDPQGASDARKKLVRRHAVAALRDEFGHGTHVAGIVAGGDPVRGTNEVVVFERQLRAEKDGTRTSENFGIRHLTDPTRLRGVAPRTKLISLRVLNEKGEGRASDVMRALEYIRERVNYDPKLLRVHGVNLSIGYEFDAEMFACGQSPLCTEVDRLVQSGVVVVTAAGNTGYGTIAAQQRVAKVGLSNTINDPGNAVHAITVGATHRDSPHTYGVSYFSSKGPTGDGRLKPDLVAPGERITSCATGQKLARALAEMRAGKEPAAPQDDTAYYVDDSGTSMAAPHVSGAIAAFLSVRREFIGKPLEVKRIFLQSATSLGRERYFEGHGLVDLMRAIQAV